MLIYPHIILFIMFIILIIMISIFIMRDIIIDSEDDDGDIGGRLVAVLGTVHLPR